MKQRLIAKRYALAILENVPKKELNQLLEDLLLLEEIFAEQPEIISKMDSYLIKPNKRYQLADMVAQKMHYKHIWNNFFKMIVEKHKANILRPTIQTLEYMIYQEQGREKVLLTLAQNHKEETIEKIRKIVADITGKTVFFQIKYNRDIVGGFVAETPSILIDGSIKNNLVRFVSIKEMDKSRSV